MSQTATFYPIDSTEFIAIKSNPNNLDVFKDRKNYVSFQGTHEGLRFVLAKDLKDDEAKFINEIFYPTDYIGELWQTIFPDTDEEEEFANVTDDESFDDFDRQPIPYHTPEKVKAIASLLNNISNERFLKQFNPEELNQKKIYPWCWNRNQGINQVYNEKHIFEDYLKLKELFNNSSVTGDYLFCFVG